NFSFPLPYLRRMSSCFFSSREKIRISRISVDNTRSTTALPKVPVPPVTSRVASLNMVSKPRPGRAITLHCTGGAAADRQPAVHLDFCCDRANCVVDARVHFGDDLRPGLQMKSGQVFA